MEIAKIFLSEVFEIEIHPGDTIEVKQGKIDVSKEIIEVLETFGHAMAIVLPTFMKLAKDLSEITKVKPEGAKIGERTEQ